MPSDAIIPKNDGHQPRTAVFVIDFAYDGKDHKFPAGFARYSATSARDETGRYNGRFYVFALTDESHPHPRDTVSATLLGARL
jgi:hypothetical protein